MKLEFFSLLLIEDEDDSERKGLEMIALVLPYIAKMKHLEHLTLAILNIVNVIVNMHEIESPLLVLID